MRCSSSGSTDNRELLCGRVIGVASGRVVGRVEDLADAGDEVADRFFDSLLEGHVGGAAALAAASEAEVHVVLLDIDQLDEAAVRGDRGVDLALEQVADRPFQIALRGETLEVGGGDDRLAAPDVLADDVADSQGGTVNRMGGARGDGI